jgi:hypothetical protein
VFTYRFFVVAQQIGDICDRNSFLQEHPRKRMTETMGRWRFFKWSAPFKRLRYTSPPDVRDSLKSFGAPR